MINSGNVGLFKDFLPNNAKNNVPAPNNQNLSNPPLKQPLKNPLAPKKQLSKTRQRIDWGICIASSLALFIGLSAGINALTRGGASSHLGKFSENLNKNLKKFKAYSDLDKSINNFGAKLEKNIKKIPAKYQDAISDTEFGNRRASQMPSEIFQLNSDISSELGEISGKLNVDLAGSLKKSVNKSIKDNQKFDIKDWSKNNNNVYAEIDLANNAYLADQKSLAEESKKMSLFPKLLTKGRLLFNKLTYSSAETKKDNIKLLADKYLLLEKSNTMSFIPKLLTKGLLALESISCTSLPLNFSMSTVNRLAFPMAFVLLGTAPTMKKTLESEEPTHKKINTFMKEFFINNALGMLCFNYAGKIINSISGLKTLGWARNANGDLLKKASGEVIKATDPKFKMKLYDWPLKAIGGVVGLGQGYEFSGSLKGIFMGTVGLIGGLGIRFQYVMPKIQDAMLAPVNKAWDLIFGKPIDFEAKEQAAAQQQQQQELYSDFIQQPDVSMKTNLTPKNFLRRI